MKGHPEGHTNTHRTNLLTASHDDKYDADYSDDDYDNTDDDDDDGDDKSVG